MELIVAVYDDWGIGCCGTQPIALSADRKFFRETTRGAMVIAGRRTIEDFPGKKPLPGRVNVALTRSGTEIPGFTVCTSTEEAVELAHAAMKMQRILTGTNPTPVTEKEAMGCCLEEICDLYNALEVLKLDVSLKYEGIRKKKMARWVERIMKGVKADAR